MAALGDKVVLSGGRRGGAANTSWVWDGSAWQALDGGGPTAREDAVMAPLGDKLVIFGGSDLTRDEIGIPTLSDTWTWDGEAWTRLNVTGPSERMGAAMAPLDGKLVLFGGIHYPRSSGSTMAVPLADTWTWDGATWTQRNVAGPSARSWASMAPVAGKIVLFGGVTFGGDPIHPLQLSDTWVWDGTAWAEVDVSGPAARQNAAMAGP
jgi:N-acetylneuraminic acid mutarotase